MNPIADAILSVVLLGISPFIYLFAQIHDKIMFKFLNRTYIYNVSWEDPRMDHRVFNLNDSDHVITIASAGCNALDYIIEGATVTAVDFNLCQIALTELKKVAILHLDYDSFFDIFSRSNMKLLREVYQSKLRTSLSATSQEFWDEKINTIQSFMYSGTSGNMSWFLFRILFPLMGLGFIRRELEKGTTKADLQKHIARNSYSIRAVAWLMDNILLRGGCCLAGVPERQMALGLHRPNNLAMVIERVFFKTDLVNDNYFYSGYILGYYKPENCPRYLRRENFDKLKANLQKGKLNLVHGTLLSAIAQSTTPFTVASLLDHMDWMPDRMINEEITHLIQKMDRERGKIFWRSFADEVHAAPLFWLQAERVDDSDDRVGMYWSTWIAHIKNLQVAYEDRVNTKQDKGLLTNLITGVKMVTFPFWKPIVSSTLQITGHAQKMESFYKYQKEGYDAFREGLLHARPLMLDAFPLSAKGDMIWVDIGGGTARNLEFFHPDVIRKYFKAIYVVDISASLLEIAQRRIDAMGLSDIAKAVEYDVTKADLLDELKLREGADIVTMSYSFTMIPDQAATINNIHKMLKKDSHLMIADFFLHGNYDDNLSPLFSVARTAESWFHKNWFACDHVYLLENEQLQQYQDKFEVVWDKRERGAVPFLPFLQPYHGVYIMKKK